MTINGLESREERRIHGNMLLSSWVEKTTSGFTDAVIPPNSHGLIGNKYSTSDNDIYNEL